RVDALGIKRMQRHRTREEVENGLFGRVADFSMKRPVAVAIPVVVVLVALIIPFSGVKFGGINETYLPPDNPTRVAQEEYDQNFPGTRTDPVKLVVLGSDGATLSQIRSAANEAPGLTGPFQFARSGGQDSQGREVVVLQAGVVDRNAATETVEYLQSFPIPAGTEVFVGGNPAMEKDSVDALIAGLPWFVLYVLVATTLLMFLAFGSLVLPIKAAIMNMLGLGATLGILTWIFVDGHLSGLLGFTPGPLTSPVVVLLMAIIYGLSTDYEVFLVSRMVEARSRGARTAVAIRSGVAQTGRIITSAALILIVVTGAFAFSEIVMMKYIAFGMIAALIIDATVIRMLLVPAVMQMLGTDNWWAPKWMKRVQERIGLGEAELDDEPELLTGRPADTDGAGPAGNAVAGPSADADTAAADTGEAGAGAAHAPAGAATSVAVLDREPADASAPQAQEPAPEPAAAPAPEPEPEPEPAPAPALEAEAAPDSQTEPESEYEPVYDTEYDDEPGSAPGGKIPASELIARLMQERRQDPEA
ncbi:MAG: MMPL family transporter, partial [Dietzia sp.]|nr:MMPL family transporter [Dietzia sp.]